MQKITSEYEIIKIYDPYKHVEACGRVCYQSSHKVSDNSFEKFIRQLISSGHESVLEHYPIVLHLTNFLLVDIWSCNPKYLNKTVDDDGGAIISGNVRAWRDAIRSGSVHSVYVAKLFVYLCELYPLFFEDLSHLFAGTDLTNPELYDRTHFHYMKEIPNDCVSGLGLSDAEMLEHRYVTVRFVCDRGVSHEIVRHREASFSQESTRFCNYSGSGIGVIDMGYHFKFDESLNEWDDAMHLLESVYQRMIERGETPQIARSVLPTCLKTEVYVTANLAEWQWIFHERVPKSAHPQFRELSVPLYTDFQHLYPCIDRIGEAILN